MINPGGTPNLIFDKSAATRFSNNQIQAAQRSMPHNAAAQQSLRKQTGKSKPSGPPLQKQQNPSDVLGSMHSRSTGGPNLPTGGAGLPPEAAQGFDPAVFYEEQERQMLDGLVGEIRTQEFINSPSVKDAATSVRFKNFMNAQNPLKREDDRNLLQQVLSRITKK